MGFDKPYSIDPSELGDTVKESILKTDLNVDDIYSNLNYLGSLIEVIPATPQETLDSIKAVDGAGSGLDADLLDGYEASSFSFTTHTHDPASVSSAGFMSVEDKVKLDGIEDGARKNVQSDWLETDPQSDAFIKNKPENLLRLSWGNIQGDITTQFDLVSLIREICIEITGG
jgi:hypothetical protein